MTFGESREQGVTRGRNFFHEPLGIALTAPQGWSIQNSPAAITLINGARDAGLVVRLVPPAAGNTHEEIIRSVIKPEQGRVERLALGGGLLATRFVGTRRNPQGQAQGIEATVATGPNNRNYLLLHAARDAAAMQRARAAMNEAELSFRPLTSADRTAAKPWAVRTVPYPRGGYAELARGSPLTEHAERQLRLLNAAAGEGEPKPGQPVKTIE